jgi:hypothetical protein
MKNVTWIARFVWIAACGGLFLYSNAYAQATNFFSPGCALSGTATSQTVNLATGVCIQGVLPGANGGQVLANPTSTIGLSQINGSATAAMRSDAAPALSQTISPTMTGNWVYQPSSGIPLTVKPGVSVSGFNYIGPNGGNLVLDATDGHSGATGQYSIRLGQTNTNDFEIFDDTNSASRFQILNTGAIQIPAPSSSVSTLKLTGAFNGSALFLQGNTTAGGSFGLHIAAGTNSTDSPFGVFNALGTQFYFNIQGDGGIQVGTPSGGDCGEGCLNAQGLQVQGAAVLTTASVPQTAVGIFPCTSSGCTTPTKNRGFSGAPSRSFAGLYTLTFSPSFSTQPACVASNGPGGGGSLVADIDGESLTVVVVNITISTTAAGQDNTFSIMCST